MTPEVIWNRDMLHELQDTLTNFSHEARLAQQRDLQSGSQNKVSVWNIPIEFMMRYDALQGHTEVDGVFVDLLLETPGHPIRYDDLKFSRSFHCVLISSVCAEILGVC